jgi:peptidoglycan hydrolase-like protein with peptidoglycan-binding domain
MIMQDYRGFGAFDSKVLLVQQYLNSERAAGLTEDGLIGPKTNEAITNWHGGSMSEALAAAENWAAAKRGQASVGILAPSSPPAVTSGQNFLDTLTSSIVGLFGPSKPSGATTVPVGGVRPVVPVKRGMSKNTMLAVGGAAAVLLGFAYMAFKKPSVR